jgi:SAM-dependent methyltransferase
MTRKAVAAEPARGASAYWDGVARAAGRVPPALWRLQADDATAVLLERWLPRRPLRRVLKTDLYDESCTPGLVPWLVLRAAFVLGMDVSLVVARSAREHGQVTAVAADARALPFRSGSFDAVVSNSTLDHFAHREDIARALRELERVLAPDGVLVLTLDNPVHPLLALRNRLSTLWRRLGVVPYSVGATHGPRGLHAALEASGFRVLELTAVHHFPRLALVAVEHLFRGRFDDALLGLARRAEALGRWPTRFVTGQYVAALARPARCAPARGTAG